MKSANVQLLLIGNESDTDETIPVDLISSTHFSDFGLVKICDSDGISKNYLYFSEATCKQTVNKLRRQKQVRPQLQKSNAGSVTNGQFIDPIESNSKKTTNENIGNIAYQEIAKHKQDVFIFITEILKS